MNNIKQEYKPNFTGIPNYILDEIFPKIKPAEQSCLIVICRKLYGWHKETDKISVSQFVKNTGMSKPTVLTALKTLEERGLIYTIKEHRKLTEFRLNIHTQETNKQETKVKNFNLTGKESLLKTTESGKESLPHQTNIKKTNTKENRQVSPAPPKNNLFISLKNLYLEQYPDYYFDGKEAGQLKQIEKRCLDLAGKIKIEPLNVFKLKIKYLEQLRAGNQFWAKRSISLGTILSSWNELTKETVKSNIASKEEFEKKAEKPKIDIYVEPETNEERERFRIETNKVIEEAKARGLI